MHMAKEIQSCLGLRIPWQLRTQGFSPRILVMDTLPCPRILEDPEAKVALDSKSLHILHLTTLDGKKCSFTNECINQSHTHTHTHTHKHTHISPLHLS